MVCMSATMSAQDIDFSTRLMYNLGGVTPLPLPSEVKSINSFSPRWNFGVEGTAVWHFSDRWAAQAALRLERKSMSTKVTVENYHTSLVQGGDQIDGNYTGLESTEISFTQLTLPLLARLEFNDHWAVVLGPYVSYNLANKFQGEASNGYMRRLNTDPITGQMVPIGPRVDIPSDNPANYDFADDLRRWQWGFEVGMDWQFHPHLLLNVHLDWSLDDVFRDRFSQTITFPMYAIYSSIGLGWKF